MKKLITVTGCFVIFCLIINSVLLPSLPNVNAESTPTPPQSSYEPEPPQSSSQTEQFYILKEYEGKIAVFSSDSDKPIKITNASVSKLPQSDQQNLKAGIQVQNQKELNRLLEDFCS